MMRLTSPLAFIALLALPAQAQDEVETEIAVEIEAADDEAEETKAIPDPATVVIPEITGGRDPKVVKDGAKYYYFWRADTSYEVAYSDFADCYRFLPIAEGNAALLPMFIAWRKAPEARDNTSPPTQNYGIVGALIGALIGGSGMERIRQARLHRCLGPMGYQRFPVAKATWEEIIDDFSPSSVAVNAKIAAGPRPDAEPLADAQ